MRRPQKHRRLFIALIPLLACTVAAAAITGCTENTVYTGNIAENLAPNIELTNGPIEGDSIEYHVHFFWYGDDPDGEIDHYEIILVDGDPVGFNPADTAGSEKWTSTISTDSLFTTTADIFDNTVTINEAIYAVFATYHTLFIRAIDDRGASSEVILRSFNAWTLAPHINIDTPLNPQPGSMNYLSPLIKFTWSGKDPIDSPWNYQAIDSARYMWISYYPGIVDDINQFPENFEDDWKKWYSIDCEGDSGISTILGDDEIIPAGHPYIIAVQAKDDAGAVSAVFNLETNVRAFTVRVPTGPFLTVNETYLGRFKFLGIDLVSVTTKVPPGFQMNFSWTADASAYGGVVSSYRYGWDIEDLNDPADWAVFPSPYVKAALPKTYYSGIHTLYIETADNMGIKTLAVIEVTIIPSSFEKDLLWIDDFPSSDFQQVFYAFPTESEHDEFWMDICLRSAAFNPSRDVWDVSEHEFRIPPMDVVFDYKNIIWSYSSTNDPVAGSSWTRLVKFTPEEIFPLEERILNYIPFYLAAGGHIWSEGMSARTGGMASSLSTYLQIFPNYLKCHSGYYAYGCVDTLGVRSMPYKDYCVSVIDKVEGIFRLDLPYYRDKSLDGLRSNKLETKDYFSTSIVGFPKKLELWEVVTRPGMFFDPDIRGFHYAEIYNPLYALMIFGTRSQSCFHPIYRMQAISARSVIHDQPVAFWTTKHIDARALTPGAVSAPSVHFGLPLWFFSRAQVDSIADAIFTVWDIK
ncbi:MAG: hypothetical protein JW746_00130 [Candidatus Krumholzibacteriota bacterium]|nr:hypothetical protein [Candidatus Krumholzibacteriota bacterium]